ncbi:MAG TPA: AAA family ATPase, partial [Rubrobacter sp.]|nr:AAA family ATPase [Rubrobacter sp.]
MKTNTPQSVFDREAFASNSRRRLAAVSVSEQQLVFGRMDCEDADKPLYVGRIGLSDTEQERILIDWRAPVGSAFYRATSSSPQGVVRRRTLITRGRKVVGINDDLLVPEKAGDLAVVAGEGALLHAL